MKAVKAYFDGTAFVPLTPVKARRNQSAIITILEDDVPKADVKDFFGALSQENYAEMIEILKDTERVFYP